MTTTILIQVRACPGCQSNNVDVVDALDVFTDDDDGFAVQCMGCFLRGPLSRCENDPTGEQDKAIELWNKLPRRGDNNG